ncbi:MAG: hypothetical protein AAB481_03600 [Patescibacteria group bacterium]
METALTSPFVLLKKAWSLALGRPNIASFLALGIIPQFLSLIFSAFISYFSGFDLLSNVDGWMMVGIIIFGFLALVVMSLVSVWYTALLYTVYQAAAIGPIAPLKSYIQSAKKVTSHLLVTYILVGLFTSLAFLLFIIPGIIIAVRFMFAPMIAAVEDRGVKPIEESKRLVKGRFWKLVGRGILMIVCYNIPLSVFQAIHPLFGTVWAVSSPIFGLYFFLVYMDFKQTAAVDP